VRGIVAFPGPKLEVSDWGIFLSKDRQIFLRQVLLRGPQYRFAIGSSSAGNSVITRQPLSVTTTSSSMRAAE
jgi:hypothetical protein